MFSAIASTLAGHHQKIATGEFLQNAAKKGIPELNYDDFELVGHVADGGYGSVWRFRRKVDGVFVAMKFFGLVSKPDQNYIEKDEILRDWELNFLNCTAKVLGYFFDSYEGYVSGYERTNIEGAKKRGKASKGRYLVKVSECLEMDILSALMDSKMQFNEKDASIVFRNLIEAVQEIHNNSKTTIIVLFLYDFLFLLLSSGIVHRDLKPENIMFVNDMTDKDNPRRLDIKLVDFGLAKRLDFGQSQTAPGKSLVGTEYFFSPEQLSDFTNSFATDVWQCGVTLYVIIFQEFPFVGDNVRKQIKELVQPFTLQTPKISRYVQKVIESHFSYI